MSDSFATLPPHVREIAADVLTPKELDAFKLWCGGVGYRRVALMLGISFSTARDRVARAQQKVTSDPRFDSGEAA